MSLRVAEAHENELGNNAFLNRLLTEDFLISIAEHNWGELDYASLLGKLRRYERHCARRVPDFEKNVGRIERILDVEDIYHDEANELTWEMLDSHGWSSIDEGSKSYIREVLRHHGIECLWDFYIKGDNGGILEQPEDADASKKDLCEIFWRCMLAEAQQSVALGREDAMRAEQSEGKRMIAQQKRKAMLGYVSASLTKMTACTVAILLAQAGIKERETGNLSRIVSEQIETVLSGLCPEEDFDIEGMLRERAAKGGPASE